MKSANIENLKRKIENFTPELLDSLSKMIENFEIQNKFSIPQFQIDEVLYRLKFHKEHPNTKLDFFENMSDLENNLIR